MAMPEDWHPEQVKAAIRMRGTTLNELSLRAGYEESAVRRTLRHRWPTVERIIADFLNCKPESIWPSRYDRNGFPKVGRRGRRRHPPLRKRNAS